MKGYLTLICCCLLITGWCTGGEDYSVANIPGALLKNANVVKRMEVNRYEITEKNRAVLYYKVAYTILNEQGEKWAYFSEVYDKLRSIESFKGTLYDATGKKINSLKKSDIKDVSGADDASFADDNRIKWHSFFYKGYPFTVEYEVELRFKGTMFLRDWIPQERSVMSVEHSILEVLCPVTNPLRYKMFNYQGEPVITEEKGNKKYTWEAKSIAAVLSEYAAPVWHEITTSVFLATEKFMLEDYEGSNANWKDFGKFVYDLKKGRDELPADVKQKVHDLTNGITDEKQKIRKLYEYMQQNTRYIGIQLGIGGWQPFDAKYVADRKYGDCKALSNFMYSLLKEAGIRSVYTVISYGDNDNYLLTDLPCSQFNHVVLFVPGKQDTTWLECTSQIAAAGYMGGGTGNRYALAIEEDGGTLVRTPSYGLNENTRIRNINAEIDPEGNLTALIKTKYSGEKQDRMHAVTNILTKDKLIEFLKEDIELPTYDIRDFNYKEYKEAVPVIDETLDLIANNYATITGKRLFIVPNINSKSHRRLTDDDSRKFDLVLSDAFRDMDSVIINVPEGYTLESVPKTVELNTKFGKYRASIKIDGNKILYKRAYEHFRGRFPAKDYPELVDFYNAIYKADRNRVVLVKKETEKKGF